MKPITALLRPALIAFSLLLAVSLAAQQTNPSEDPNQDDDGQAEDAENQIANTSNGEEENADERRARLEALMAEDPDQVVQPSQRSQPFQPVQPLTLTDHEEPKPEAPPEPEEWESRIVATTTLQSGKPADDTIPIHVGPPEKAEASPKDGKVRLHLPYPPRPLEDLPAGWRLEAREDVPATTHEVTLANGETISLKVSPFVLVPINMAGSVALREPRSSSTNSLLSDNLLEQAEALRQTNKKLQETLEAFHQHLLSIPSSQR